MKPLCDPALPGLATAIDVAAVLELLQRELPECGRDVDLVDGTVVDVRYEPGTDCTLLYNLKFRDRCTQRHARQLVSARVLAAEVEPPGVPDDVAEAYRRLPKLPMRTARLFLPGQRALFMPFPVDPTMPWLVGAVDPARLERDLQRMGEGDGRRVRGVDVEVLGYAPRSRAAFRYAVDFRERGSTGARTRPLIAKTHVTKDPGRLFAGHWALWEAAAGAVGLARPVGLVASLRLTLQEQVGGERLGGLAGSESFAELARKTGGALARFHALSLPLTRSRGPDYERRVLRRWSGVLQSIHPALGARVRRLQGRIAAELRDRTRPSGPVHGDFHHTNVLVDGGDVTFIDLDEMAYGDPLVDVGRLLASFRIPSLRVFGDPAALADAGGAFLEEYLQRAGAQERDVRLFEAASLFIAAVSAFRIQRRDWGEEVPLLVDEAERAFQRALVGSVRTPREERSRQVETLDDQVRWAADATYVQARLAPYLRDDYGVELTRCRSAFRRRAQGVCQLRYELSGWRGEERWRGRFEGLIRAGRDGGGLARRLEAVREGLEGCPEAPLLPRPVVFLAPLCLLVLELPGGAPLTALLDRPDGPAAGERVARALAALHGSGLELRRSRGLDRELASTERRLSHLAAAGLPDSAELLAEVRERAEGAGAAARPSLNALDVRHVCCNGERVGVRKVDVPVLSHPLIGVGRLLAGIELLGLEGGRRATLDAFSERFRCAYAEATGSVGDVAAFEALALLHLASEQVQRDGCVRVAAGLLDRAAFRLEGR